MPGHLIRLANRETIHAPRRWLGILLLLLFAAGCPGSTGPEPQPDMGTGDGGAPDSGVIPPPPGEEPCEPEAREITCNAGDPDPDKRAFGGELIVSFVDGTSMTRSIAVANAHPLGAKPFQRDQYVAKFRSLTDGIVEAEEQERFLEGVMWQRLV